MREYPECFSDLAKKGVETFGASLTAFPLRDPQDVAILETLNAIRGKFKAIVAALGMHRHLRVKEAEVAALMADPVGWGAASTTIATSVLNFLSTRNWCSVPTASMEEIGIAFGPTLL